jgi:ABC-type transport system involved in multi-copper enzyme maturation permease subunit
VEFIDPAQATKELYPVDWVALLAGVLVLLVAGTFLVSRGQSWSDFRSGLALGLGGLLSKELRSRSRGWRPMLLLTGYLLALTLAVAGFLALMEQAGGAIQPTIGLQLFSVLALGLVMMLAFITPALTVGAVSGERERRTLELLLVTRASPLGLAAGKLLGALVYILFLLVASLPAFALVYLFAGVPPTNLGMVLAVAVMTAVAHAALGLMMSALLRRTLVASVVTYLVVLATVLGLPFISAILGVSQMARPESSMAPTSVSPPVYLYASPLMSVSSVLPGGGQGFGGGLVGDIVTRAFLGGGGYYGGAPMMPASSSSFVSRTVYVTGFNPMTGQTETAVGWAPWVYHFLIGGVLTLLSVLVAAVSLAPVKPWRGWRTGRRPAAAPVEQEAA